MIDFLHALSQYRFLQTALIAGTLASLCCGIVGTYVVTKRITYIAGGIAHCTLGGIGLARYLQVTRGWDFFHPLHGAVLAALVSAAAIGLVTRFSRQREDTVIGATWAVGMAMGILFISKTPGYNEDIMAYLFGNILMVSPRDLVLLAGLDLVVLVISVLFYKPLLAVCFDEEFARLRGVNVEFYSLLLLGMIAVTVVLLVSVVGIILVIALLTLPAAIAGTFTTRLWKMMLWSSVVCFSFNGFGLFSSYRMDLPAGATTVLLSGLVYLILIIRHAARGAGFSPFPK